MPELVPEQRAAVADRERDLFLAAGAGSGKTRVLVERFCDAVCEREGPDADTGPESILAFTFTEKAAGELKRRIRTELAERAAREEDPDRARLLRSHARAAESAWISTIHAFCRRLLAAYPLAAGLDPRFAVLDEAAAERLRLEAFEAAFRRFGQSGDEERFEMAAAFGFRDLRDVVAAAHDDLRSRGYDPPELPELPPPNVDAARAELADAARAALAETEGACAGRAEHWRGCMAEALRLAEAPEAPAERALEACKVGASGQEFQGPAVERYRAALKALRTRLVEREFSSHYDHLRELVRLYAEEVAERKRARSALDFEDLQLEARRLLERRPDVRARAQGRFRHLMVDEFQDTNELQLAIVGLLHTGEDGEPRNRLFTVGDEFQSIYAFRHADVEVFRRERARLAMEPEERGGVRTLLGNFRSHPGVLACVNRVSRDLFGSPYEDLTAGAEPSGSDEPAVEVLVTERQGWDEGEVELEVSPDEQAQRWRVAEARHLARRLRELHQAGRPRGEMVVLLRSYTYVEAYEQALRDEGLDPYVVGGRGYWSAQQVSDVRHLLASVANPLDEFSLLAALASPACGVRPDTLWLLRAAAGGGRIWHTLRTRFGPEPEPAPQGEEDPASEIPDDDADRLRTFTAELFALREEAPRRSLESLIDRAITRTGYDLALLMRPGGRRRMANVRKLMRLAREYEADAGRDLRGFLDLVAAEGDVRAREGEAALRAEGHDGVRVMTVHAAKGLEFPLVAVADLGRGLAAGFPPMLRVAPAGEGADGEPAPVRVGLQLARLGRKRYGIFDYQELQDAAVEREREEERRILYVAMTRAEERLILSGVARRDKLADEKPTDPLMHRVLRALGSDGAAGTVMLNPPEPRPGLEVALGWPEVLVRLHEPTPAGIEEANRAQAALPDTDGEVLPEPLATLPDPDLAPPAGDERAPVPHLSYSALALYGRCGYRFYAERVLGMRPRRPGAAPAGEEEAAELPPEEELDALDHRYARGIAVHELLERSARRGWSRPGEVEAAAALRREGVEGPAEVARTLELVDAFLASPLRAELEGAHLLAEAPFAFRLGATTVRGEIDLFADRGEEVVVVDYKSDRLDGADPAERMDRYDVQRKIYALAALRRHGRPVRVAYVFLERPDEPVEATYSPDEAYRLERELSALVGGIEAGRFPVTDDPGLDLCLDCPARELLCVHGPERTLRERVGTVSR